MMSRTPVRACEDLGDIGIVMSIDHKLKTFVCQCAANTLADMSRAKRAQSAKFGSFA